jgi:hypothetical protein
VTFLLISKSYIIDSEKIEEFTKILQEIDIAKDWGVLSEMKRFQPPTAKIITKFRSG